MSSGGYKTTKRKIQKPVASKEEQVWTSLFPLRKWDFIKTVNLKGKYARLNGRKGLIWSSHEDENNQFDFTVLLLSELPKETEIVLCNKDELVRISEKEVFPLLNKLRGVIGDEVKKRTK